MTSFAHDPTLTALDLIKAADEEGLTARLLGGIAIALHCPVARLPPFERKYEDIDIVIEKRGRKQIDAVVASCGFLPDVQFNNLHGLERRTYYGESGKLDVFIGEFAMCHKLSFDRRLEADHPTVALADLLLTKAQIYELNRKDAVDLVAILADHPIGAGDDETINIARISDVCAEDWGLWRTVTRTLETVDEIAVGTQELSSHRDTVVSRIAALREAMERSPKSVKWKLRSRVGDRMVWYELPEDEERHPATA